eukprot:TRINITY_DN17574_c0_g2_i1.p1 TRINITY_DN17574_c0_g2~~TRINITY_DN17574_c0_g2_i1.p1  ORF type:complete len:281 (-),score=51.77 TRINITY_DN17574_c0_g2_i1:12-854(-)
MMITRGTRGDVQPFIALARGLAEIEGWMVTIVTELRYYDFIKSQSKVSRGAIRFRPSGGDSEKRVDSLVSKWTIQIQSELVQAALLARSEAEFFVSEPLFYHWASTMHPDLIIYGFTMTSIAVILSEALRIPILGFILQPTCIPSRDYLAVVPINTHEFQSLYNCSPVFERLERSLSSHSAQRFFKEVAEDSKLNVVRSRRGLSKKKGLTFGIVVRMSMPMIIPIHPMAFCATGKPSDWHKNIVLTDFISLKPSELSPERKKFGGEAKKKKKKKKKSTLR